MVTVRSVHSNGQCDAFMKQVNGEVCEGEVWKMDVNHKRTDYLSWDEYFSFFSCLSVVPWMVFHFTPMSMKQLVTLLMAGLFAAGGQFTITAAYTYAPAGKISIFDYSQIIFATMLGFILFGEIPDKYSFTGYVLIILASLGTFLYNMRVAKAGK